MPISSILIFHATFIFIVLIGLYIYVSFYNKRTRTAINKFIDEASGLTPTVFYNIKLSYSETSGLKTYFYPSNRCDLYVFDNFLAIVRRQDFVFKVFFAPILLASDMATTKNKFSYLDIYKPDRVNFIKIVKGEIDIRLIDPKYKHYKADIRIKGLTIEQKTQLEKIKNWC